MISILNVFEVFMFFGSFVEIDTLNRRKRQRIHKRRFHR